MLASTNDVLVLVRNYEYANPRLIDVESPYTIVGKLLYWRMDIHIPEDIIEEIGMTLMVLII